MRRARLHEHAGAGTQRLVAEPEERGIQLAAGLGQRARRHDDRAAGRVELVGEAERDRLRCGCRVELARPGVDARHGRRRAAGEHLHPVADAHRARGDAPREGAVVAEPLHVVDVVRERALRPDDELHRHPQRLELGLELVERRQRLEELEQARAVVPGRVRRALDHVVAGQGRDRDDVRVGQAELAGERRDLVGHRRERRLGVPEQVDLVHRDDDVRHAQQLHDGEVAAGLLEHAVARVDEHDDRVGRGRAGDHVARVLHVAGAVGEDERPAPGREVAVGDVDRDALLALGAQAVGEQREVDARRARRRSRARPTCGRRTRAGRRGSPSSRAAGGRPGSTCRRRRSRRWRSGTVRRSSEVPVLLAVLHGGLGDAVVGAGRAALGERRGRDLDARRRRRMPRPTRPHRCSSCRRRCGTARCGARRPRRRGRATPRRPRATCRRGGTPRARARSTAAGARCPRARCSATRRARSSSRWGRRARAGRPCGGRCRGPRARGAGCAGPTGRTRRAG